MKNAKRSKEDVLVVDAGNTSILFGYYRGDGLKKTFRIQTGDIHARVFGTIKKHFPARKLKAAVIASVVPKVNASLKENISRAFGLKALFINKEIPIPITNKYRKPKQVGVDRLMNALAVFKKYRREAIVIDFGTAITFDVVSRQGEYLGGVIAPGIGLSIDALFQKTALLPKIRLAHPKNIIGRDTVESIRVGCSFGIGGLCDRIIDEIKSKTHPDPIIIATGGYAHFMAKYCHYITRIDPQLTLKGILLTYQEFLKNHLTK